MRNKFRILPMLAFFSCGHASSYPVDMNTNLLQGNSSESGFVPAERGSWAYFLRHLPIVDSPVRDYRGQPVGYQEKQAGILPYDVGSRDLQQCADALMRLRAEYLFSQQRTGEIGFHFTDGSYYSFDAYCKGLRPVSKGAGIRFVNGATAAPDHPSLRRYLDIVYTYAGTISLAKELKQAEDFAIGTVVIYAGSPGHCFMIVDEKTGEDGEKLFKLAEGYTPAQSIYILRNLEADGKSPWHKLKKGVIETASYRFTRYELKKFE
ncbi:MAG TPA: DUF4846 domain-containing protein [Flavisolibacter sp.]|nr:DUF4846 domain-containing protein [Flavisolibacter sp.]